MILNPDSCVPHVELGYLMEHVSFRKKKLFLCNGIVVATKHLIKKRLCILALAFCSSNGKKSGNFHFVESSRILIDV